MRKWMMIVMISLLCGCTGKSTLLAPSETVVFNKQEASGTLSESINAFGWDLYDKQDQSKNLFYSPLSLELALGMLGNGAQGKTLEEILDALYIEELESFNQDVESLINKIADEENNVLIANSVWIDDETKLSDHIQSDFLDPLSFYYQAEAYKADLGSTSGIKALNNWVKQNTDGLIDSVLDKPDSSLRMVLMNTVFFEGTWHNKFKKENTYKEIFYGLNDEKEIDMMHASNWNLRYIETEELKGIVLPYRDSGFKMLLLISKDKEAATQEILNTMSTEEKEALIQALNQAEMVSMHKVVLPRFKIETSIEGLNDILKDMGLNEAYLFSAELDKIGEDLYVSDILQKAVLQIDEEGTKAAAVSAISMNESAALAPDISYEFVADHPFFLLIQDSDNNAWFMGLINDLD